MFDGCSPLKIPGGEGPSGFLWRDFGAADGVLVSARVFCLLGFSGVGF